jgi:hypothetical protein
MIRAGAGRLLGWLARARPAGRRCARSRRSAVSIYLKTGLHQIVAALGHLGAGWWSAPRRPIGALGRRHSRRSLSPSSGSAQRRPGSDPLRVCEGTRPLLIHPSPRRRPGSIVPLHQSDQVVKTFLLLDSAGVEEAWVPASAGTTEIPILHCERGLFSGKGQNQSQAASSCRCGGRCGWSNSSLSSGSTLNHVIRTGGRCRELRDELVLRLKHLVQFRSWPDLFRGPSAHGH